MVRLLYKHYGGIEWFYNKPFYLFISCLKNCIEQERKIYDIAVTIINKIKNVDIPVVNKTIRTAEEIMKDYGLN